jgi:arylsulfatase A-like enzyme
LISAAIISIIVLFASITGLPRHATPAASAQTVSRPNILFIITDDQRLESGMGTMPNVNRIFGAEGTQFTNFSTTTPLCCPSRGSFWSGRYAHNHGVLGNDSYPQPQLSYDQSTAFQSYLRGAGYRTAIVGKYWNQWPIGTAAPGYDRWAKFAGGYASAAWGIDGVVRTQPGYSTDFLGQQSIRYLQEFEQNDAQPWLLYVAPHAPHSPMTPAAQYANAPVPAWTGNPAVAETDKSDKPPNIRSSTVSFSSVDADRTAQLRTLMSVDDVVQQLFTQMDALGETQDTLAIYTSDNGYMWGEHGRTAKRVPYTQSFQVPFFMRWPGHVTPGAVDPRLTANVDVAPTLLEAAGIAPAHAIDGISMFGTGARSRLLLEYFKSPDAPLGPWAATLTPTYQYTEWYDVNTGAITFREYYDVVNDPWQLQNLLGDATTGNDPDVASLHAQLAADRACSGTACPGASAPDVVAPTTPGTPTGTSTVAGSIQLTWAASDDDVATTIQYRVYRDGGSTPVVTVASASTTTVTATDTGPALAPGSSHTYTVVAFDGTNVSSPSLASDPIVVASPPPASFTETFSAGFTGWTILRLTLDGATGATSPPSARAQVSALAAYGRHALPASVPSACVSEAVNVSSIGTDNVVLLKLLRGTTSISRIVITPTRLLRIRNDVSGVFPTTGATMASGWHTIELCTTTGTAGSISARLDGTTFGTLSAQNVGVGNLTQLQILDETKKTVTVNVDDVVVR